MLRAGLTVAIFVLLGRITGFGREWLLAVQSGASGVTDVAIVLLTFPDLMVNLLLGGGLTAALIPAFKRLAPGEASALYLQSSGLIAAAFTALALLITLAASSVLRIMAPGMPGDQVFLYANEIRLVAWAIPLTALSGVIGAYLNAHERFAYAAAGTLVFNVCVMGALLWGGSSGVVASIVVGVMAGAMLRLAIQATDVRHIWSKPQFSACLLNGRLIRQYLANFSFVAILVLLPPIARAIASYGETGALALFNFAYKLVELPLGVALSSIAVVLLPRLAAGFSGRDRPTAEANLAAGIRATLLISLGIAIPAIMFPELVVRLAFFNAAFTSEQVTQLAGLTAIGFLSLPFQGLLVIYGSAFAADRHVVPLVLTAAFMPMILLVVALPAESRFGVDGVMAAYVFAYFVGAILMTWQVARHFGGGVIRGALRGARGGLLLPGLSAVLVAWFGREAATSLGGQLAWACLAFATYVVVASVMDDKLRRLLRLPVRNG